MGYAKKALPEPVLAPSHSWHLDLYLWNLLEAAHHPPSRCQGPRRPILNSALQKDALQAPSPLPQAIIKQEVSLCLYALLGPRTRSLRMWTCLFPPCVMPKRCSGREQENMSLGRWFLQNKPSYSHRCLEGIVLLSFFLGQPHPWPMEVPRPGVKSKPRL